MTEVKQNAKQRRRPISCLDICVLEEDVKFFQAVENTVSIVDGFYKSNFLTVLKMLYDFNAYHTSQEIMDTCGISRDALDNFIKIVNEYAESMRQ